MTEVCKTCNGEKFVNRHANLPDEPCPDCKRVTTVTLPENFNELLEAAGVATRILRRDSSILGGWQLDLTKAQYDAMVSAISELGRLNGKEPAPPPNDRVTFGQRLVDLVQKYVEGPEVAEFIDRLIAIMPPCEVAGWQWQLESGQWVPAEPPNLYDYREHPGRFRPVYTHSLESSRDTMRLDWLEKSARASLTGISFDWVPSVEGERSGWRYMRQHYISNAKRALRAAIDEAMSLMPRGLRRGE